MINNNLVVITFKLFILRLDYSILVNLLILLMLWNKSNVPTEIEIDILAIRLIYTNNESKTKRILVLNE